MVDVDLYELAIVNFFLLPFSFLTISDLLVKSRFLRLRKNTLMSRI